MSAGHIAIVVLFTVFCLVGVITVLIDVNKKEKVKRESQRLQDEVNKIKIKENRNEQRTRT